MTACGALAALRPGGGSGVISGTTGLTESSGGT